MESKFFKPYEFQCKCCQEAIDMDPELISKLDRVRERVGRPIQVLSGYRCEDHNSKVGGVSTSYHCEGKAVDLQVRSSRERLNLVQACLDAGFRRVGIYKGGFIHVDVGTYPDDVMWVE